MQQNFSDSNPNSVVAQTEKFGSAKAKTQKAWCQASKTGLSITIGLKLLVCICLTLACTISGTLISKNCYAQPVGNFFDRNAKKLCHRGHKFGNKACKVSNGNCLANRCISSKKFIVCVKSHKKQCETKFVRHEIYGFETNVANAKSQKPSAVSGNTELTILEARELNKKCKGLITPSHKQIDERARRNLKIRRIATKLRKRRQQRLINRRKLQRQQRKRGTEADLLRSKRLAGPSIQEWMQIYSTSDESSAEEHEHVSDAGVHTSARNGGMLT